MLVVRATKKLRDRVKTTLAGEADVSTTVLGDWFATASRRSRRAWRIFP